MGFSFCLRADLYCTAHRATTVNHVSEDTILSASIAQISHLYWMFEMMPSSGTPERSHDARDFLGISIKFRFLWQWRIFQSHGGHPVSTRRLQSVPLYSCITHRGDVNRHVMPTSTVAMSAAHKSLTFIKLNYKIKFLLLANRCRPVQRRATKPPFVIYLTFSKVQHDKPSDHSY